MRSKSAKIRNEKTVFSLLDKLFMKRALKLAKIGGHAVLTNPMVGAVLVKNSKVIAEGYHHAFGDGHAEVECMKSLHKKTKKVDLSDAVLYVTLEPCSHHGKTPPCVDLIIKSGIGKVVIANFDANPLVSGQGVLALRKAGIDVTVGLMEDEAAMINQDFFYSIVEKRPFLVTKIAATLDGKVATADGDSFWITNEMSRKYVQKIRAEYPAILTTSKTVIHDNPHLGLRDVKGKEPLRIIIDRRLETSPQAKVYRDSNVVVVTTSEASAKRISLFRDLGIELMVYPEALFEMERILRDLYLKKYLKSILVEAGGTFNTMLFQRKLVQRVYYFVAPKFWAQEFNAVGDIGISKMAEALLLSDVQIKKFGNDVLLIGNL